MKQVKVTHPSGQVETMSGARYRDSVIVTIRKIIATKKKPPFTEAQARMFLLDRLVDADNAWAAENELVGYKAEVVS